MRNSAQLCNGRRQLGETAGQREWRCGLLSAWGERLAGELPQGCEMVWLGTSAGGVERAVEWCRVAGREVYTSYAVELVWNGRELLPDGAAWDWQFLAKVLTDV